MTSELDTKIIHEIHRLNIAFNKADNDSKDKIIKQYKKSIYGLLHIYTLNKDETLNINEAIDEVQDKIFDDMNLYKKFKEEWWWMLVDLLNDIRLETNDQLKVILQAKEARKKAEKSATEKEVVVAKKAEAEAKLPEEVKPEQIEKTKLKAVKTKPPVMSKEKWRRERKKNTTIPKKKKISASEVKEKIETENSAAKENKENIFNEKKINEMKIVVVEKLNQFKSLINSYISKHNIVEEMSKWQQRVTNWKEELIDKLQSYFNENKDEIFEELSDDIKLLKLQGNSATHLKEKLIYEITIWLSVYNKLSTEQIMVAITRWFFLWDIDTLIKNLEK